MYSEYQIRIVRVFTVSFYIVWKCEANKFKNTIETLGLVIEICDFKKCRIVKILHHIDVDVEDSALLICEKIRRMPCFYNIANFKKCVSPL